MAAASVARLSLLERALAAGVLFYAGVVFCLPVPFSEEVEALYPWWGKRITVGNVQLHEILFILWFALYGGRYIQRALLNRGTPLRQAALWLTILALWCGLISLLAPLAMLDLGRTFRLLLNAALALAVVRWARRGGDFPLAALILGFFVGTVINFVLSFKYPLVVYQTMRLSGQNTPGVAMAMAIHLCAWLFYRSHGYSRQVFLVVATGVFTAGAALSYSRIGWFAAALGLLAWVYVLILVRPRERSRRSRLLKIRLTLTPILIGGLTYLLTSPIGQQGLEWLQILAEQKFSGQAESDTTRWAYVTGTAEILLRTPFGVGYSGFMDAMIATDTYRSGTAVEEVSIVDANPHAAFLWYAAAGGVPGLVIALALFAMLLYSLHQGLVGAMGQPGFIFFALAAAPYLLIGMTVPYLFNSIILIVPAAIAAGWGAAHGPRPAAASYARGAHLATDPTHHVQTA